MNEENLVPLTSEKAREIGKKGGIASGKAKRKRKLIKEQINLLLSLPLKDRATKAKLEALGIDTDNIDNQMAMVIAMWQKALKGDVNAFNTLRDTVGEKPIDEVKQTIGGEIATKQKNAIDDVISQMKPLSDDDM